MEDNLEMSNFIYDKLKEKYNIFLSGNGRDALELIKKIPRLDLILSDIMMDKMDGYEFFDELSFMSEFSSVPFIFLTAKTDTIMNLNERQRKNNINELKNLFTNVFEGHMKTPSIQQEQPSFNDICDDESPNDLSRIW